MIGLSLVSDHARFIYLPVASVVVSASLRIFGRWATQAIATPLRTYLEQAWVDLTVALSIILLSANAQAKIASGKSVTFLKDLESGSGLPAFGSSRDKLVAVTAVRIDALNALGNRALSVALFTTLAVVVGVTAEHRLTGGGQNSLPQRVIGHALPWIIAVGGFIAGWRLVGQGFSSLVAT